MGVPDGKKVYVFTYMWGTKSFLGISCEKLHFILFWLNIIYDNFLFGYERENSISHLFLGVLIIQRINNKKFRRKTDA